MMRLDPNCGSNQIELFELKKYAKLQNIRVSRTSEDEKGYDSAKVVVFLSFLDI